MRLSDDYNSFCATSYEELPLGKRVCVFNSDNTISAGIVVYSFDGKIKVLYDNSQLVHYSEEEIPYEGFYYKDQLWQKLF